MYNNKDQKVVQVVGLIFVRTETVARPATRTNTAASMPAVAGHRRTAATVQHLLSYSYKTPMHAWHTCRWAGVVLTFDF